MSDVVPLVDVLVQVLHGGDRGGGDRGADLQVYVSGVLEQQVGVVRHDAAVVDRRAADDDLLDRGLARAGLTAVARKKRLLPVLAALAWDARTQIPFRLIPFRLLLVVNILDSGDARIEIVLTLVAQWLPVLFKFSQVWRSVRDQIMPT